jgi:hypothetical protein
MKGVTTAAIHASIYSWVSVGHYMSVMFALYGVVLIHKKSLFLTFLSLTFLSLHADLLIYLVVAYFRVNFISGP